MINSRRQLLKSFGATLAIAGSGASVGLAQTSTPAPDYARLSSAVLNSYGLVGGQVWTGSNTGTLKSDDLVRAAVLLRTATSHLDEIGVNTYLVAQLSKPPSGTISPDVIHTIGEQLRSYGILLTDSELQQRYSTLDPNTQQQALLDITQLGVNGSYNQLASAFDLAAKKLRLLEIATACGGLLDLLPSSQSSLRALQANAMQAHANNQASTGCTTAGHLVNALSYIAAGTGAATLLSGGFSAPVAIFATGSWILGSLITEYLIC
jgi:hypothetical protein